MEISEIRVKLVDNPRERLLAFCTVTFSHQFVVRDVKIIDGPRGPFVAMPSRKVMDRCPKCGSKNHLRAAYCNDCGGHLNDQRAPTDNRGRPRLHVDVAHPINQECRSGLEDSILSAYEAEQQRAKEPGYVAPDLDGDIETYLGPETSRTHEASPARKPAARRGVSHNGRRHRGGNAEHFQAD